MPLGLPLGPTGMTVGSGNASMGGVSSQALPLRTVYNTLATSLNSTTNTAQNSANALQTTGTAPSSITALSPQAVLGTSSQTSTRQSLLNNFYPASPLPTVSLPRLPTAVPAAISAVAPRIPTVISEHIPGLSPPSIRMVYPLLPRPIVANHDELFVSHTSVKNNSFELIDKNGITAFRPEILSVVDYKPVYTGKSKEYSNVGKLIDIFYQSRMLREETLENIINDMDKATQTKTQLNAVTKDYKTQLDSTKKIIDFYSNAIDEIEAIKDGFDLKNIPDQSFETPHYLTMVDFFAKRMFFPKTSFSIFSDTKILYQMLFDFREIAENYSFSLFDLTDPNRSNDRDPVRINKSYRLSNDFRFTLDVIKSESAPINATEGRYFTNFVNALPSNTDDRVKLLLTVLSKEMRISKGLAIADVKRTLSDAFGSKNIGSPFDNIIGTIGDTIFNKPFGDKSLASLITIDLNTHAIVLPFENKYVDRDDIQTTFVPGSNYFIDSILELTNNNSFNTGPLLQYVDLYLKKIGDTRSVVEALFDLKNDVSFLTPVSLFKKFITSTKHSTDGLYDSRNINHDQAMITALFDLATTDKELKLMLFQFICLAGIATINNNDQKKIFDRLAREFGSLVALSYVRTSNSASVGLDGGLTALYPFLEQLARDIESRALFLVNDASTPIVRVPLPPDFQRAPVSTNIRSLNQNQRLIGLNNPLASLGGSQTATVGTSLTAAFRTGTLVASLLSSISSSSISASNLVKEFIDIANRIDQEAQVKGSKEAYILDDQTGRTRYNFVSTSTLLLLIFEILTNLVSKYTFAHFTKSQDHTQLNVEIDSNSSGFMSVIFDDFSDSRQATQTPVRPVIRNSAVNAAIGSVVTRNNIGAPAGSTNIGTFGSAFSAINEFVTHNPGPTPSGGTGGQILLPSISTFFDFARQATNSALTVPQLNVPASERNSPIFSQLLQDPHIGALGNTPNATSIIPRIASLTPFIANLSNGIPSKLLTLKTALQAIRTKIYDEDLAIANFLHFLNVIGTRLTQSRTKTLTYFNTTELTSVMKLLNQANPNVPAQEQIKTLANPEQVRSAIYLYNKFAGNYFTGQWVNKDTFLQNTRINRGVRNALFSLFSENQFREGESAESRVKLITVGVPSGMSKRLVERIDGQSVNASSFLNKEFDVITINVYKRSEESDDIIFKPQKFVFDLSIFPQEMGQLSASEDDQFNRIIQNANNETLLIDYEKPKFPKIFGPTDLTNNPKYSFLSATQKTELIRNHLVNELLNLYILMLTGVKLDESTFINYDINLNEFLTDQFRSLVAKYLKEVKRVPLSDGEINQIAQAKLPTERLVGRANVNDDILHLVKLISYGNIVFQPQLIAHKVLTPKSFDRIFTIPINIEAFEVDVIQTTSTQSGKLAYNKESFQRKIERFVEDDKGKIVSAILKKRNKDEIIFEDYFVTIELVG
jgi:hypothetical protein